MLTFGVAEAALSYRKEFNTENREGSKSAEKKKADGLKPGPQNR
jgi:hypothetical protein